MRSLIEKKVLDGKFEDATFGWEGPQHCCANSDRTVFYIIDNEQLTQSLTIIRVVSLTNRTVTTLRDAQGQKLPAPDTLPTGLCLDGNTLYVTECDYLIYTIDIRTSKSVGAAFACSNGCLSDTASWFAGTDKGDMEKPADGPAKSAFIVSPRCCTLNRDKDFLLVGCLYNSIRKINLKDKDRTVSTMITASFRMPDRLIVSFDETVYVTGSSTLPDCATVFYPKIGQSAL